MYLLYKQKQKENANQSKFFHRRKQIRVIDKQHKFNQ
jgi:hypothetical protein